MQKTHYLLVQHMQICGIIDAGPHMVLSHKEKNQMKITKAHLARIIQEELAVVRNRQQRHSESVMPAITAAHLRARIQKDITELDVEQLQSVMTAVDAARMLAEEPLAEVQVAEENADEQSAQVQVPAAGGTQGPVNEGFEGLTPENVQLVLDGVTKLVTQPEIAAILATGGIAAALQAIREMMMSGAAEPTEPTEISETQEQNDEH